MPDRDLITDGRRLLAAATPGPWVAYAPEPDWWWVWQEQKLGSWGGVVEPRTASPAAGGIGAAIATDNRDADAERADAELIAHMRNTYGQLLDELEQAHAALTRLQRETQEFYVAIAAKQDRDTRRLAMTEELAVSMAASLGEIARLLGIEDGADVVPRLRAVLADRPAINDPRNRNRKEATDGE
ncbi:hypothetical protein [Nocardia otitidiscaviarum]|uniref:hypothetical protein n=1 Tax=Nocardia otitidiscaviarum TaxID=1823 RepID=UPI0004A6BCE3|nr:hypothetical protein [Nocardia otitidiscaviarum]